MPSRSALVLAIGLAFAAPIAHGAGLGRITVQSALGQPLRAEVEVTAVNREEATTLAVRLASAAAFRQANLEFNPALAGLRVSLDRRGEGGYVVRIASPNAVTEPYLDLLLELTSSTGRVVREYTILLDPPALRASPDVVAPAAAGRAPAQAATASAAPAAAPRVAPAPAVPATAMGSTYEVRRGETLGSIAEKSRPASASLDQMLVALFRANPSAFIGGNMNSLRAGSVLQVPQEQQVLATDPASARREVSAQSADFARYRSRLAQAPAGAGPAPAAAAGQGRVTTRVEDGKAPAPAGDQLKIAPAPAGTKGGDEAVARDRQLKDLLDRVAELERTNQQLQKALELQSKAGTQVQAAAEGRPAPAVPAATVPPAPAAAPAQPAPQAAPPPSAAAPAPSAAPPPPPAAAPKPAEAPKGAAPKGPMPAEEPGFLSGLLGSNLPLIGGLGAVLVGLFGYRIYRRRKSAGTHGDYALGSDATQGNSLFGGVGGRSIDTGTTSGFNSSFIPAATQVDSTEVDPVAEADVYIAYGREEQAEDILKEALRIQPDRHPARVKLMEMLSRRGDKAGFSRQAADLMARTGGAGDDWARAVAIGRSFDPGNPMFAASAAATADMINREQMTELRLGETTRNRLGLDTAGYPVPPATAAGAPAVRAPEEAMAASSKGQAARRAEDAAVAQDTQFGGNTVLPLDSRANSVSPAVGPSSRPSREGMPTELSELEFEAIAPATQIVEPEAMPPPTSVAPLAYDLQLPSAGATPPKLPKLPDLDLNLGPATAVPEASKAPPRGLDFDLAGVGSAPAGAGPASVVPSVAGESQRSRPAPPEEAVARPTLLGGLTALPEGSTRFGPNTDAATVPLIDFDLSGAELPLAATPTRGGALTGSPMAAQIATKLDLARGYIDLGVKDGARELLDEVMRDGTRDQRQEAIELMKQIER